MENAIRHEGTVEKVATGHVQVRIVQTSACAACSVASRCGAADARQKLIDVAVPPGEERRWHAGQRVTVATQPHTVGKALLLGFGLPLALMLAVLVGAQMAGCGEGMAALMMLGVLVPYYIIMWCARKRIDQSVAFTIE